MNRDLYLGALAAESAALLAAARVAGPAAPVPDCPGWSASDLLWHIAEVQHFWAHVVRERPLAPDGYDEPARPSTGGEVEVFESLAGFAAENAAALHGALVAADPAARAWTWTPDQGDVAWVTRRMAHEAAMHRLDAERSAGRDHRLDPELAADGVDEFLTYFLPVDGGDAPPLGGSVHLHCTDIDGEWTVALGDTGAPVVSREHAKGDAALRGSAHDLLTVLWRRAPLDTVAVFGDADLAAAFVARASNE